MMPLPMSITISPSVTAASIVAAVDHTTTGPKAVMLGSQATIEVVVVQVAVGATVDVIRV